MNLLKIPARRFLGPLVGALSGVALVAMQGSFRGPVVLAPYVALVATLSGVSALDRTLARGQRFGLLFSGFMVASLVLYIYIILIDNPSALAMPLFDHAWRLGFLTVTGAVVSAAGAFVTERREVVSATG